MTNSKHDAEALEALASTLTDSINGYEEAASVAALEAANGLRPLTVSGQELPYLWFADEDTTAAT